MVGAARLECGKPAAEAGELIRRQLANSFGDFFDFHVAQYSTDAASMPTSSATTRVLPGGFLVADTNPFERLFGRVTTSTLRGVGDNPVHSLALGSKTLNPPLPHGI